MNAAARAINQYTVFNSRLFDLKCTRFTFSLCAMVLLVLFSSLFVVYLTNSYRENYSYLQKLERDFEDLQEQHDALELEEASLDTPSRIQAIALQALDMHIPLANEMQVLRK